MKNQKKIACRIVLSIILGAGIAAAKHGTPLALAGTPSLRLIAHFNDSIADSSPNGYFGESSSGNVAFVPGKLNQAGSFDPNVQGGTNFIYQKYPTLGTADFSMAAWVNIDSAAGNAPYGDAIASVAGNGGTPCENGSGHSGHLGYIFGIANDRAQFQYCYSPDGSDDNANTPMALNGSAIVADGSWHFIALTRSTGTFSLYVDGLLDAAATTPNTVRFDFDPAAQANRVDGLVMGAVSTAASVDAQGRYNGLLDEFAIFDRALPTLEVNCFYNGGVGREVDQNESECTGQGTGNAAREPVVIVPGITGSRLNRASDGLEVWPNAGKMLLPGADSYLDELALDATGKQVVSMNAGDIMRDEKIGPFNPIFYENLIDAFTQNGYVENQNLFVAPYDWRLDIGDSLSRLDALVSKAKTNSPNGKVNIVAHSMGGLLIKKYLGLTASSDFIDKLILAGVPQLGAPDAFKTLNYGDNLGAGFGPVNILNPQEIKNISQNMPAVYNLLPSRKYVQAAGGYVEDFRNGGDPRVLDYDGTTALMLSDASNSRNAALLNQADLLHQGSDAQPWNADHVYGIMGCENPQTIGAFRFYDKGKVEITATNGDGTVPLVSAANLGSNFTEQYFVLNGRKGHNDHMGLVRDNAGIALIKNILDDHPDVLPEEVSTSSAPCFDSVPNPTTIIFSTHSPVTLHVYDSQGRHAGPATGGDIDLGIPSSDYLTIGENNFAIVPAGDSYKVIAQGLSSGNFDLETRVYGGDALLNTVTHLSVPLLGANTSAEFDFSNTQGNMDLHLDSNGDGAVDATIQPTAVLDRNQSTDITPPSITLPTIPPQVMQGDILKLAFGATDAESGVAALNATLNGTPILSDEIATFTKPGKNVFLLQATDKAGNPRVGELDFKVLARASFSPIADTYVRESTPNKNHGTESILRISRKNRALLKFDQNLIQQTIGTSAIISAKLKFTIAKDGKNWDKGGAVHVLRMTRDWTERGATWNCANDTNTSNNKPDCKGNSWNMDGAASPFAATFTTSTVITSGLKGTITFDVTSDVKKFLNGGAENHGWIIKKENKKMSGFIKFTSREARTAPELTITYAPE